MYLKLFQLCTLHCSYSKKRQQNRYVEFDPRPENATPPDKDSFLRNIQELPGHPNTMWGTILRFNYEDHDLEGRMQ